MTISKPVCKPLEVGFEIPLKDGERAQVRPISPADEAILLSAFEELSLETRAHRWLTPLSALPERMVYKLTHVDQHNHVAWGVAIPNGSGQRGIGVGRFVRLEDAPQKAEFALTVVDAYQGKRIGTFLLALLYRLAQHEGIATLRGIIAPDHRSMILWMKALGANVYHTPDGLVQADLSVETQPQLPNTRSAQRFGRIFDLIQAGDNVHPLQSHVAGLAQ